MDRSTFKKGIKEFREQAQLVSNSYGGRYNYYLISMLWCLFRYGARPLDYTRFEFHKKSARERNRYLTLYRYVHLLKKFGRYNEAVFGKIAEYRTYSDYIKRPWMVADNNTSQQDIRSFIEKQGIVFAKPNMGDQGKGVLKIKSNDVDAIEQLLKDCATNAFVVEGAIEQAPEIAAINPTSVNTIRSFTLLKNDGTTKIISILLRAGKPGMYVDNWGSGGICYNFDLETGVCDRPGVDKKQNPFIFHPGSNFKMVGYQLPNFEKLKALIVEMSQKVPEARYVGWDIAITPTGYELVEANCPGGHDILQPFGTPYGDLLWNELK